MVRIMKSITLDTTHNFTQFVRYTLSWRKRQSENEALPVTILVTRQRTLDDTIDAIKIYGHFISIYSIKLFIYFILLHLYVIRNKFARVNFYISFFLFSRWRGREREEYKIWTRIWERRDKLKKNRDWHQSTEQPDYIVSNVEIIESYYYFQGLDVTRLFRFFRPRDVASWREINSYRALLSFRRYSSAFFSPRHTLPTSPHPPALGGLCALSLLNPIIHRDYSSTVRGPSPFFISFFFFFLFLSQLPPPPFILPLKHCSFTTRSYLSYALHIWFSLMS